MSDLRERALPAELGGRLRQLFRLPSAPPTIGELLDLSAQGPDRWGLEDLFATGPTRHRVRAGERRGYTHCALDALLLAFLQEQPVEIASHSPAGDTTILAHASASGLDSSHPDAVMSLGATRDGGDDVLCELCPIINVFPSRQAYDAWVAAHPEVVSIALPLAAAFELARGMAAQRRGPGS